MVHHLNFIGIICKSSLSTLYSIVLPYSTKVSRDKIFAVRSPCEYSQKNFHVCISIAQKFQGTKLSWLDHHVNSKNLSVCIKNVRYSIYSRIDSIFSVPGYGEYTIYDSRNLSRRLYIKNYY